MIESHSRVPKNLTQGMIPNATNSHLILEQASQKIDIDFDQMQ